MLTPELAAAFARVAAANVQREYPRRLDQLISTPDIEWRPRRLHPAFYGSYDWHSAVHMHWLLARLLRLHPALEPLIAPVLDAHLNETCIGQELRYFHGPGGATFERPYGWAWLLELEAELLRLGGRWSVAPLAALLAERFALYLRSSAYPVRAGTHGNTAFACILAMDYARIAHNDLVEVIGDAATRFYAGDRAYPVAYEPSGDDFLSGALVEALLMQELLPAAEFRDWKAGFLDDFGPLAKPPRVLDHEDAKQSHLDGLCLSRAWCFQRLGYPQFFRTHLEAGMPHVVGGHYNGEHWLASFAALALSAEALKTP